MTDTPTAGGRIKAATTPAPYAESAPCSTTLTTSSATPANIVGASVTIITAQPNAVVTVIGFFDMTISATGGNAVGTLVVDGSTQSGQAIKAMETVNDRATVGQFWTVPLASAGSHSFQLQGAATASGTVAFGITHTTLNLTVFDW
jgi:hypothetical protein